MKIKAKVQNRRSENMAAQWKQIYLKNKTNKQKKLRKGSRQPAEVETQHQNGKKSDLRDTEHGKVVGPRQAGISEAA